MCIIYAICPLVRIMCVLQKNDDIIIIKYSKKTQNKKGNAYCECRFKWAELSNI